MLYLIRKTWLTYTIFTISRKEFKVLNNNQFSKFELIESGIFDLYKSERYSIMQQKKDVRICNYYERFSKSDILKANFKSCEKIYNCISRRKSRVFKKLIYWFYYTSKYTDKFLMFGTLTFTDEVLEKTSKETRRRYVARFLNDNTLHYVANIDYGKTTNREHYHFIALLDQKIDKKLWTYGFTWFSKIKKNTSLRNRKNYLLKLTNHTYKDSTKQEKIISDRKKDNSLVVLICKNKDDFDTFKNNFYLELFNSDNRKS